MTSKEVKDLLARHGAVLTGGHFVYKAGDHGDAYVAKDALFPHPSAMEQLAETIAERNKNAGIQVVTGAVVGGAILAQHVGQELDFVASGVHTPFIDKEGTDFVIRRGYGRFFDDKRVLIVEDILTTGKTARRAVELVRAAGASFVMVMALVNRGGVTSKQIGAPLVSLLDLELTKYPATECPLCAASVPVNTQFGHGREFLATKATARVHPFDPDATPGG